VPPSYSSALYGPSELAPPVTQTLSHPPMAPPRRTFRAAVIAATETNPNPFAILFSPFQQGKSPPLLPLQPSTVLLGPARPHGRNRSRSLTGMLFDSGRLRPIKVNADSDVDTRIFSPSLINGGNLHHQSTLASGMIIAVSFWVFASRLNGPGSG